MCSYVWRSCWVLSVHVSCFVMLIKCACFTMSCCHCILSAYFASQCAYAVLIPLHRCKLCSMLVSVVLFWWHVYVIGCNTVQCFCIIKTNFCSFCQNADNENFVRYWQNVLVLSAIRKDCIYFLYYSYRQQICCVCVYEVKFCFTCIIASHVKNAI